MASENRPVTTIAEAPREKDFSGSAATNGRNGHHNHLDSDMESDAALKRIQTAGSISISPELFEKIYLSPQNVVKGDLRKTFANPTPLCLLGFILSLTPLACDLMGWRGAGGSGAASIGVYFFFGGLLMVLGAVGEFILGNTFSFVVFGSFGAFWLSFGATLQPSFNAYGAYAPAGSESIAAGLATEGFNSSFAFFMLSMGLLDLVYLICSIRTNIIFVVIFTTLTVAFPLLAGTYWQFAQGNADMGARLLTASGATLFVTCMAGWYIFAAIMFTVLDLPFSLPVGDLSTVVKGASAKTKAEAAV